MKTKMIQPAQTIISQQECTTNDIDVQNIFSIQEKYYCKSETMFGVAFFANYRDAFSFQGKISYTFPRNTIDIFELY